MEFDHLPDDILLPILQRLPFKERFRIACVNRRFKTVSEMAISRTKALSLTAPIFRDANEECMTRLFQLCAPNLKELICEVTHESQVQLRSTIMKRMCLLSKFQHPRVETLKLDTMHFGDGKAIQKLLAALPNLRKLEWNHPQPGFVGHTVCEKLEDLKLRYYFNGFCVASLAPYCPNLKIVSFEEFWCCSGDIKYFNSAFSKWPALHTLEWRPNLSEAASLEKIVGVWKLISLRTLLLGYDCHATDSMLEKISVAFPQLERLEVDLVQPVTSTGCDALKTLKHLRHITLSEWQHDKVDTFAAELISFEFLETVEIIGACPSTVTVSAFAHRCPKLRRLEIPSIRNVNTPTKARNFVQSLNGFVQEKLVISITFPQANLWDCAPVMAAIAQINQSANGRQITITKSVYDQNGNVTVRPLVNEWDTDSECQRAKEPTNESIEGISRLLIDAIWNLLMMIINIFK